MYYPKWRFVIILILSSILIVTIGSLAHFYISLKKRPSTEVAHISIVSAHNMKFKELFVPFLKEKYKEEYGKELEVEWVKYGGQNANLKVIDVAFRQNGEKTCGHDVIWGGGDPIFHQLNEQGRLALFNISAELDRNIPSHLLGIPLYEGENKTCTWIAVCLSTFGILYNEQLIEKEGFPTPNSWEDLSDPLFYDQIVLVDPIQSSSAWTIYSLILQLYGWEKGWLMLITQAGNATNFLKKASESGNVIVNGSVVATPCIAYYGRTILSNTNGLNMIIPLNTVLNTDPIAILKGGSNPKEAQFCLSSVLSKEFQQLLISKAGTPHGPKDLTFGRIGVNKEAYATIASEDIASTFNPYNVEGDFNPQKLDIEKSKRYYPLVTALFKASLIDCHYDLKKAWKLVTEHGNQPEDIAILMEAIPNEEEVEALIQLWGNIDAFSKDEKMVMWANRMRANCKKIINKYHHTKSS